MFVEEDILQTLRNYKPRETVGWGADDTFNFEEFQRTPFSAFTRVDRGIRCIEFTSQKQVLQRNQEEEFQTVGQERQLGKLHKKTTTKKPVQQTQYQPQYTSTSFKWDHSSQRRQKFTQGYKRVIVTKTKFKDSVTTQAGWETLHEAQKQFVEKCPISIATYETLLTSGQVKYFKKTLEKTKVSQEVHIPSLLEDVISSSTLDDPYLASLIKQGNGQESLPTVYATDKLLFAILTLKYSVYPWDILVTKNKNQIILDKAPENKERSTYLELQTINENTSGDMKEEEKQVLTDCEESTLAAWNWFYSAIQDQEINPELSEDKSNQGAQYSDDFAYKYVKIHLHERNERSGKNEEPKLGHELIQVVLRTQVDACDENGEPILIKSLNESDLSQNWRKQLETQSGQLTSQVYMANTNNMAKWLCQAAITQVDTIKIGFLCRQQPKDINKHSLLQVDSFKHKEIASIIGFKIGECWQNLRYLVDFFMRLQDGNYVILKQAYKPAVRIYRIDQNEEQQNDDSDEQ